MDPVIYEPCCLLLLQLLHFYCIALSVVFVLGFFDHRPIFKGSQVGAVPLVAACFFLELAFLFETASSRFPCLDRWIGGHVPLRSDG